MNIPPIGPTPQLPPTANARAHGHEGNGDSDASNGQNTTITTTGANGEGRGVLRLLQEGHFRGVSDVRLRINFSAQLTSIQSGQFDSSLTEGIGELLAAIEDLVAQFLEDGDFESPFEEAVTSARVVFSQTVITISGDFDSGQNDLSVLLDNIRAAFDDFVTALQDIFGITIPVEGDPGGGTTIVATQLSLEISTTTITTSGVEGQPPVDPVDDIFSTFLASLQALFDSSLSNFGSLLQSASTILPALSEPSGNGGAFEKFLNILNGLDASNSTDTTEGDTNFTLNG